VSGWWVASYVVLWGLVLTLGVVVVALARQIGTLHLRLGPRGALEMDDEGPPLGEPLPSFDAEDVDGAPRDLASAGEARLMLFVSPGCFVCRDVLPALPVVAAAGQLSPYVLTDVDAFETKRAYGDKDLGAPLISARFIAQKLDVPGTPYVIVTDRLGVVRAKGTVNNLEQMEGLVDSATRRIRDGVSERERADA